jgi:hypothetical protein
VALQVGGDVDGQAQGAIGACGALVMVCMGWDGMGWDFSGGGLVNTGQGGLPCGINRGLGGLDLGKGATIGAHC